MDEARCSVAAARNKERSVMMNNLRQSSLWLWQLDPEMLKEADMLDWLARRLHADLSLPTAD